MIAAFISFLISISRAGRSLVFVTAIVLPGLQSEAWAQAPMLPHRALPLPVDRGPLTPVAPPTSTAASGKPDRACPERDCALPPSQETSTSLPGARLAATSSATVPSRSCDLSAAGAVTRAGAYAPRHAEIALTRRHGTFLVRGAVNECLTFDFHLDSGAADVTLSSVQFEQLRTAGAVFSAEIVGRDTYVMADGRTSIQEIFLIRTLQIGPMIVRNVRAAVMPGDAPPLLGMSFLGRFHAWSVNNHREVLSLNLGSRPSDRP